MTPKSRPPLCAHCLGKESVCVKHPDKPFPHGNCDSFAGKRCPACMKASRPRT
jgi:hypothetical protein